MSLADSFTIPDVSVSDNDDLDSLPSTSTESFESDYYDAQKEWEQSLEQLELLLTMILIPFAGKFLGRKFAYWSWARYMEWSHSVEINWSGKTKLGAAGVVGGVTAAKSL